MKNLVLTLVFMLSLLIQLQANNAPIASKVIVIENEKSIILNSANQSENSEVLTIKDSFGKVVFSDIVELNKQRVKYDLTTLPSGGYIISVDGHNVVSFYEVIISDDQVHLKDAKSYYRPSIQNQNEKVLVTAALENKEDIQISIYNNTDELVYRYNTEEEETFNQAFNLKHLPQGEYNVVVSTDYFIEQSRIKL